MRKKVSVKLFGSFLIEKNGGDGEDLKTKRVGRHYNKGRVWWLRDDGGWERLGIWNDNTA